MQENRSHVKWLGVSRDANVLPDLKWEHVAGRFATEAIGELNVWHDMTLLSTTLPWTATFSDTNHAT
jgi:hypothetical protein